MSFSTVKESDFFGRAEELSVLFSRIQQAIHGRSSSAVLSGPAGIGKTELLKQLFCHLFWKQDHIVPFYYAVNPAMASPLAFSRDYLARYLSHRIAFERKEQSLLSLDGASLESVSAVIEERGADWARDILDRYRKSTGDPVSALRIAVCAPQQSALMTGMPVAVLLDDFHLLREILAGDEPGSRAGCLFEAPMSFGKTPHILAGNASEIFEMQVSSALERISLRPLEPEDCSSNVRALLGVRDAEGAFPADLLGYLAGNPLYLASVVRNVCAKEIPNEQDYRNAYCAQIADGSLSHRWSSTLKRFFPQLGSRRSALITAHRIFHAREALSGEQLAKTVGLTDGQAEAIPYGLYLAGVIKGEFGVFRPVENNVLRDVIDFLYRKEIEGVHADVLEQELLTRIFPEEEGAARFEMTLPMNKEVELVAAQCLDQIGKNLHVDRDIIGQMQIAVIEACINAAEHGRGADGNLYVVFAVGSDRIEVSVESSGQEFVVQETGEPFEGRKLSKAPGRGWGIKLMKRFVDEVRFEKTRRGTKTVLIKSTAKKAGAQKESTENRE